MAYKTKIVCLGDSGVRWWELKDEELWPSFLQKNMIKEGLDVEVINKGIPGDCTTGMVGRFYHDVVMLKPDYVIISGGGNDMWWNVPLSIPKANLYSMIKQALQHNIIPVLTVKLLRQGNSESATTYRQYNKVWEPELGFTDFIARLSRLSDELMKDLIVPCDLLHIDFRDVMSKHFFDEHGNKNAQYFCPDGMHLSVEGNMVIGRAASEYMRTLPQHQGILRT